MGATPARCVRSGGLRKREVSPRCSVARRGSGPRSCSSSCSACCWSSWGSPPPRRPSWSRPMRRRRRSGRSSRAMSRPCAGSSTRAWTACRPPISRTPTQRPATGSAATSRRCSRRVASPTRRSGHRTAVSSRPVRRRPSGGRPPPIPRSWPRWRAPRASTSSIARALTPTSRRCRRPSSASSCHSSRRGRRCS